MCQEGRATFKDSEIICFLLLKKLVLWLTWMFVLAQWRSLIPETYWKILTRKKLILHILLILYLIKPAHNKQENRIWTAEVKRVDIEFLKRCFTQPSSLTADLLVLRYLWLIFNDSVINTSVILNYWSEYWIKHSQYLSTFTMSICQEWNLT